MWHCSFWLSQLTVGQYGSLPNVIDDPGSQHFARGGYIHIYIYSCDNVHLTSYGLVHIPYGCKYTSIFTLMAASTQTYFWAGGFFTFLGRRVLLSPSTRMPLLTVVVYQDETAFTSAPSTSTSIWIEGWVLGWFQVGFYTLGLV